MLVKECSTGLAKIQRVLQAFKCLCEILVTAKRVGDGKICLLDAAQHFLIKLFLECLGRLENGIGVRVFGLQIGDDFGGFLAAKPGVMIDAAVAMQNVLHGFAPGDRGLENCTC